MWYLSNIRKDFQERFDIVKAICAHIRPEAYEQNTAQSTSLEQEIEERLGRKLTPEERLDLDLAQAPEEDVDTIERI